MSLPKRESGIIFQGGTVTVHTASGVSIHVGTVVWACTCGHLSKEEHERALNPDWERWLREKIG